MRRDGRIADRRAVAGLKSEMTQRKAAELHDSLAASLAATKFRIEAISKRMEQGCGSPESMKDLPSTIGEVIKEVRRIMADLRPSILDDLGVLAAVNWFDREYQKSYSHISVEKQIGIEELDIPDSIKTPIFRIYQEALNNVAKHSRASHVNLSLQKEGERIMLTIQDNGQGFDLETVEKGMGLSSIRERATAYGNHKAQISEEAIDWQPKDTRGELHGFSFKNRVLTL